MTWTREGRQPRRRQRRQWTQRQRRSGGALLDITGRLIGINNAMSTSAENIGFAIPMDIVREQFQQELLQSTSFVASASAPWAAS